MAELKPLKFVFVDLRINSKTRERPVVMVSADGYRICKYPSIYAAAKLMGIPASAIVACLKGRRRTAGGYCWKYWED